MYILIYILDFFLIIIEVLLELSFMRLFVDNFILVWNLFSVLIIVLVFLFESFIILRNDVFIY